MIRGAGGRFGWRRLAAAAGPVGIRPRANGSNVVVRRPGARRLAAAATLAAATAAAAPAAAQTEFHFQFGELLNPFSARTEESFVLTLQQATQWKYGSSFYFVDYLDDRGRDGFNERDFYAEWYPTLSLGKVTGRTVGGGPLIDVGFIAGLNAASAAKVVKYLPGVRLSWKAPGFVFLNTDFMLYLDGSSGVAAGGAPKTDDGYNIDVSWLYPFSAGEQSFQITGHAEYIGSVTNEFGDVYGGAILAQPQFRWDLGKAVGGDAGKLFAGIEYQYWRNKLGTAEDETAAQLLLVWQL